MNADFRTGRGGLCFALALALSAPGGAAADPDGHVQEFQLASGSRLLGQVKSHEPDGEWVLVSPDAGAPIHLKPGAVRSFSRLSGADAAENPPAATLVFVSGDRLPADIAAFDGTAFEVRVPWAAETRSVKWGGLQRIVFAESGARRVFAGPLPGQKWEFTAGPDRRSTNREPGADGGEASKKNPWRVENGALTADGPGSGSIDADLPDQVSITYDLEWTGMLSMSMGIFTDAFLPSGLDEADGPSVVATAAKNGEVIPMTEGIAIDLNQHSIILRSHSPDQGQDMLGSGQLPPEFRNRTSARVTVRIDRTAGHCGIWFGDRLLQKWTELGNLGGRGKGLSFWQHHGNGTVAIRRLVVRSWNGKFEEESPAAEEDRDILVAADGTRVTGKLGAMVDGQFALETSVGLLDVAMADLRHLVRASGKEEKSERHRPRGALITLAAGTGRFYLEGFRVESDGGVFIGRHAELGELSIPSAGVESVSFHTNSEAADAANEERRPVNAVRKIILPGLLNHAGGGAVEPRRGPIPLLRLNR
jgi:hypothetical protein